MIDLEAATQALELELRLTGLKVTPALAERLAWTAVFAATDPKCTSDPKTRPQS